MRTLVVYYSRTGNTKFVAQTIAKHLDAKLSEVIDEKNRQGKLTYLTGGYASFREKLTVIKQTEQISDYDLIIVGSPVWAGKIAPAIRTFLVKNDFSNKQVAYFITSGGDKGEKTLKNMEKTINPQLVIGELAITNPLKNQDETEKQVIEWCEKISNI